MKVVINKCYGGFGLSARAVQRLCELKGRPCFFFVRDLKNGYIDAPLMSTTAEAIDDEEPMMFSAYDIPNPSQVLPDQRNWYEMSMEERRASNAIHEQHSIETGRGVQRHDPDLVRVVEEMGDDASGRFGQLVVVDIPDGTDYEIEEYDGLEHVAEAHQTWG